ncbi:protein kinase, putative, partial [Bodo saltans]
MEYHDDEALSPSASSSSAANNNNSDQFDHQHHLDDDDARVAMIRAIQNEVELLERAARHDHIVSYYGSMITAEHHKLALVMEYVSGGSLASIVRRQKGLRDSVIRAYGRDVLLGLQYLHEVCRMCHRDIKPDNILVTPEGRCKLADFGASRALERTALLKTCVGTPYYMAPEVVQGEGYDESADIWSFGATLFEMASGKPPFADISNGMAVMFRVATLGKLPDIPTPNSTSTSSSSSTNPLLAD